VKLTEEEASSPSPPNARAVEWDCTSATVSSSNLGLVSSEVTDKAAGGGSTLLKLVVVDARRVGSVGGYKFELKTA